jgi:hypothetical protein
MGRRLYFPSEGRRAEDFFRPKNQTDSAGCEPVNLGTKSQHSTSRPTKSLCEVIRVYARVYVVKRGYARLYVGIRGYVRVYVGVRGYARVYVGVRG